MLQKNGIFLLFFLLMGSVYSQPTEAWYVFFKQRPEGLSCASLSPRALERRERMGIPLDANDCPVPEAYVRAVQQQGGQVRHRLRWLNALSVEAEPEQLSALRQLPFVERIEPIRGGFELAREGKPPTHRLDTLRQTQRRLMQLDRLQEAGLTGKGVRIALIDAGFRKVDKHPGLAHLQQNKQIVGSRNFYRPRRSVYRHHWHGLGVLSCIAGKYGDSLIGCAPDAEFLLARTEHSLWEKRIEEDHWIAAAEWADSMGADIINTSLGYIRRYEYQDLDGKTHPVSLAAGMAARKGILVVCSQGNEGAKKWHYLSAPADHPAVLAVGGTFPFMRHHIRFSSFGPSAAGFMKPNLVAPAYVLVAGKRKGYRIASGTSFASPLVAGLAACMMQKYPEKSAWEIFRLLEQGGHLYPYYDYAHGYGVPDAAALLAPDSLEAEPTFEVDFRSDSVFLRFSPTLMQQDSSQQPQGKVLYYHFERPNGLLDGYDYRIVPYQARGYIFRWKPDAEGTLRIWFGGYLYERKL